MWPLNAQKTKGRKRRADSLPWQRPSARGGARSKARNARAPERDSGSRLGRILSVALVAPLFGALIYGAAVSFDTNAMGTRFNEALDKAFVGAGFGLASVTVSGRTQASPEAIRKALRLEIGMPLFRIDCAAARQRLLRLDWVGDAEVRRLLPNRIHVFVTERKPIAVWQHEGQLRLIDATGHPIVAVSTEALSHYPHVVGDGAPQFTAALLDVLGRFPELESRVTAAIRVGERRWTLEIDNGIQVELPAEGIDVALGDLVRLEKEQRVLERGVKAIDLRFKDKWILRMPTGSASLRPNGSRDT